MQWGTGSRNFPQFLLIKNLAVDLLVSIKSYRKSLFIFKELSAKVYLLEKKKKIVFPYVMLPVCFSVTFYSLGY